MTAMIVPDDSFISDDEEEYWYVSLIASANGVATRARDELFY